VKRVGADRHQPVQTVEPVTMTGSMFARIVVSADGKTVAYCHGGRYALFIQPMGCVEAAHRYAAATRLSHLFASASSIH